MELDECSFKKQTTQLLSLVVKEVNICLLLVYWKIAGIPDKTYFYGVLTLGAKMTKVVAAWVQQFAPGWLSCFAD